MYQMETERKNKTSQRHHREGGTYKRTSGKKNQTEPVGTRMDELCLDEEEHNGGLQAVEKERLEEDVETRCVGCNIKGVGCRGEGGGEVEHRGKKRRRTSQPPTARTS